MQAVSAHQPVQNTDPELRGLTCYEKYRFKGELQIVDKFSYRHVYYFVALDTWRCIHSKDSFISGRALT